MAVLFLAGLSMPGLAAGQSNVPHECDHACAAIVDAMFAWILEAFHVPLREVLVDTTRSGFELSATPDRSRVVKASDLTETRAKHGFGVTSGGGAAVHCDGRNCTIDGGSLILSFNAPAIAGVSATMRVAVSREAMIQAGPGVDPATVGKSRISFTLYAVRLRKLGPVWIVTSADVSAVR